MKKVFLAFVISCFTLAVTAQSERSVLEDEWYVSIGVNAINTLGSKNPLESPGDWAFKTPLSASVETRFTELFSMEIGLSLNGIDEIDVDNNPLGGTKDYYAIDTSLKYYFGEYIFPEQEWVDFYINAGLGLFIIDDANLSLIFGGGVLFWMNESHTFGIKTQALAKFAADHSDRGRIYANNHFQYSIQAIFKL
jgi:hypothetical protein